jgi:hypothetical protein
MGGMTRTLQNRIRLSQAFAKLAKLSASNTFTRDKQICKLPKCKLSSSKSFRRGTENNVDSKIDSL